MTSGYKHTAPPEQAVSTTRERLLRSKRLAQQRDRLLRSKQSAQQRDRLLPSKQLAQQERESSTQRARFVSFAHFHAVTGGRQPPSASSTIAAAIRTASSSFRRPTICTPMGNPSDVNATGTQTLGRLKILNAAEYLRARTVFKVCPATLTSSVSCLKAGVAPTGAINSGVSFIHSSSA